MTKCIECKYCTKDDKLYSTGYGCWFDDSELDNELLYSGENCYCFLFESRV